ncbi:hypothetical protein PsorP6_015836 [Peronosclerospora sorghi]|uniref:Uncharacterized protein n=1 Tax=Peronosclerospora sorghi TaxID=230839 RepID=A0ACC0WPX4_9STRA|nr:hypothetical protein PsorP6_015836 [Peronosclerospora sorghi]
MMDIHPRTRIQSSRPLFSARNDVLKVRKTSEKVFLKVRREETLLLLSEARSSLRKKLMVYLWMVPTGSGAQQTEMPGKIERSSRIAEEEQNSSDVNADAHADHADDAHASIYRGSSCGNCQCSGIFDAPTPTLDADDVIDAGKMDSAYVAAIDFIPMAKLRQCITAAHAVSVIPTYSRK